MILQRLIWIIVAAAAAAAAAIVSVFAAAFAVYAVLKALFGAAGAAAVVCLCFAILAAIAAVVASAKAKKAFQAASVREAPPPSLAETMNEMIRKRPLATAGVALAAGLAATLQPKLAAAMVKAFFARGDQTRR